MQEKLLIGTVLKPQGIRGEVKIKYYTDAPEDVKKFGRVFIDGEERRILSFRTDGEAVYLGLYGIADRNEAELLRGKEVYAARADAPAPAAGTYYIVDLLGCKVFTQTGREIGELVKITPAATDVYTVRQGEKEILFPAVKGLFTEISPEDHRIVVDETRFNEVAVV